MATIIDGRGNITRKSEDKTLPDDFQEESQVKVMSIEEYRELDLTDEQEWNNMYNPKRSSIEALISIEIKKRGRGKEKRSFYPGVCGEGPYYDPSCSHVHVWKKRENVDNFIGEQYQNVPYVQYTNNKPGLYCTICHAKNIKPSFKWNQKLDDVDEIPTILQNPVVYKKEDHLPDDKIKIFPNIPKEEKVPEVNNRIISNWNRILTRTLYASNNGKILYTISKYKSLYLWPWQLTPYQKFKLQNKDYNKSSNIFVKNEKTTFQNDYAFIA